MKTASIFVVLHMILFGNILAFGQATLTDDSFTNSASPQTNYGSSIADIVSKGSNSYLKFSLANFGRQHQRYQCLHGDGHPLRRLRVGFRHDGRVSNQRPVDGAHADLEHSSCVGHKDPERGTRVEGGVSVAGRDLDGAGLAQWHAGQQWTCPRAKFRQLHRGVL